MKIERSWRGGLVAAFGVVLVASACQRPGPPPPLLDTEDVGADTPEADMDGERDGDPGQDADAASDLADAPPDDSADLPVEDMDAPDTDAPDTDAPDTDAPDMDAPDMDAPDMDAPDMDTPDMDTQDMDTPDMDTPDMDTDALPEGQCRTAADCDTARFEACFAGRCGDIERVSVGYQHVCALREDRTLACWGSSEFGAAEAPPGLFLDVSAGRHHTCAIQDSNNGNDTGLMRCWGLDGYGEATTQAGLFRQISAGETHTCALNQNNRARCWGELENPASSHAPAGDAFLVQISAGARHNCALEYGEDGGPIRCWGEDLFGQASAPEGAYLWVTSGWRHSCGVQASDGRVVCWGDDAQGQVSGAPAEGGFTGVEADGDYTCAWAQGAEGRDAVCWGGHATPAIRGAVGQVSVGANNGCGVYSDGALRCWGSNVYGQALPPVGRVREVVSDAGHTCTLDFEGRAQCWGENSGADPVEGLSDFVFSQISASEGLTCGILSSSQEIFCWSSGRGVNLFPRGRAFSQLSAGRFYSCAIEADTDRPFCVRDEEVSDAHLQIPEGLLAVQISAGEDAACALDADGEATCWGGAFVSSPPSEMRFSQISSGYRHACGVLRESAEVVCWGEDEQGQATPPVGVPMHTVAAGTTHSCGITLEGHLACWGRNLSMDLSYATPAEGEYLTVSATSNNTCALRVDGRAICQGYLGVLY
jgi:alpha-tubulin suppressor-like RCC1 family protein